ncbi:nuclear factor of activated T-cells, cytoplasmic 4 isoform X2 [Plutella xylostella]|uniref:nuclear factor of activated T-cells, cytoplasmic 4 isoform X2 n=1 Tax=Plutella xylostella TaxID=51655 RepID=UPI0020323CEA|nr:nuclear factor of activated T-cells, cytoplasmic 4 isoform X2 [Plutella xylostella]
MGMKMTMSTTSTMSARIHRKVMRAPHKRAHPGKMPHHAGKMTHHAGKLPHHAGKMTHHAGKLPHHAHAGKLSHLGKFGKFSNYPHTAHSLRPPEPCDNSNDSGLGTDHDQRHAASRLSDPVEEWDSPGGKRRRTASETEVKVECDNATDAYTFTAAATAPPAPPPVALAAPPAAAPAAPTAMPHEMIRAGCSLSSPSILEAPGKRFLEPAYRPCGKQGGGKVANKFSGGKLPSGKIAGGKLSGKLSGKYGGKLAQALARRRALALHAGPPGLAAPLMCRSRDGRVELQILCQPESQHRARYQTEGSRGAVKDNSGNGFPIVKLVGYDKPAVLQVFIGTDTGRVAPHMFYQACRVSGKNSTPCKERKEDGTVVIEIDLEPAKNWQVTCDCVGILKERNVDVEHRFGEALSSGSSAHVSRGKKKSTRCRMVFRTEILNAEGHTEALQVCSTQIICTQPPGVPEVCRKSLVSAPATGGLELYLLGKNFLKETRVVFCHRHDAGVWEEEVVPDKEFLQQTHLVCCVPPYHRTDITETVSVQFFVRSGGKTSEPHSFYYTPPSQDTGPQHCTRHHAQGDEARPVLLWAGAMPPPPAPPRRPSLIVPEQQFKAEAEDESQSSLHDDASCEPPAPEDLRLKTEHLFPSPPPAPSPLASFTQQLQAMQNQVQTDKMVETVTAAIFNSDAGAGQIYAEPPLLPLPGGIAGGLAGMRRLLDAPPPSEPLLPPLPAPPLSYHSFDKLAGGSPRADGFDPFRAHEFTKMESERIEQRLAEQSAHMEALVEDAMKATAAMLPGDAAKLDELVNSRADDHLAGPAPPPAEPELLLMPDQVIPSSVKTPPAAVKSMILNAAAEILTSDSTMNALVTSAINTANILSTESEAPPEPAAEAPLAAMSHAVSQAVTQAVSQAVSHAVSQAVTQEMSAPVQGLTDMSDSDLLSYINTSTFDQV